MSDSGSISTKRISPERGKYISPRQMNLGGQAGQRPGDWNPVMFEALKGRNMIIVTPIYFALSGLLNTPIP
jgi:hypothetical protein